MQPENTTAPPKAQAPDGVLPNRAFVPVHFSKEQRQIVLGLIRAERAHASRWWGLLNEMRCRNELPEWARCQNVGAEVQWDAWNNDCTATNALLFGESTHINRLTDLGITETAL